MNRTLILVGVLASAAFVALAPCAVANTAWYVNGVRGSDGNNCKSASTACKTIGHAISLASSGGSVMLAAATYKENLNIGRSLNLIGAGASTTTIDGSAAGTVIAVSGVPVTLSNVTIRNGSVKGFGAGIYNTGTLTINGSVVSGNQSFSTSVSCGGGVFNSSSGRLTINASTISGNGVFAYGNAYGGAVCNYSGSVTINNSTLSGNGVACGNILHPCYNDGGGAIYSAGTLVINNSTISSNGAGVSFGHLLPLGGGIWNLGRVHVQNSILANNNVRKQNVTTPSNCYGGASSHGYNLSSDNTCHFSNSGDRNNIDPVLGPLQNNGGPTQTMALLSGSPAIDAGNPSGCTDSQGHLLKTDQRGMPRPDSEDKTGCDMGAYESQSDAGNSQVPPVDFLHEDLALGSGSNASANACRPLGSSCTRGLTGQCCIGSMCGYRGTCCDRPLRNEICASNAECCSGFCYKPPPSGIGRCM